MSYRVQIDIYGDREKNKEQSEKEERKNDKWFWIISIAFLMLIFALYSREMFTRVLLDRKTKVGIEQQGEATIYQLETQKITVTGQKDQEESALITFTGMDDKPITEYRLSFSIPSDWEHSVVTVKNGEGVEVYKKQYNGFDKEKVIIPDNDTSLSASYTYETLIALAFGKGTRIRGDILLYAIVWLMLIAELLSFKLWKWVFLKYRIKWAVYRDKLPSSSYKLAIGLSRFALFILIIIVSVISYGVK